MTTLATFFDRLRGDYLSAGHVEPINRLATAIDADDTRLTLSRTLGQLQPDVRISIGLEDFYVFATDGSTRQVDVDRGFNSTTAASAAVGALVRVRPRWSDAQLLAATISELRNLTSRGVVRYATVERTTSAVDSGYNLASDFVLDVWRVQIDNPETNDWSTVGRWQFEAQQNTTDFTSGRALFLREDVASGRTLRITYKAELGVALTALSNDVETVTGLDALDLLAAGVALQLGAGREFSRNHHDQQGSTRRAEEVPPGAQAQSLRSIRDFYERRLAAVKSDLSRRYPDRERSW